MVAAMVVVSVASKVGWMVVSMEVEMAVCLDSLKVAYSAVWLAVLLAVWMDDAQVE